MGGGDMGDPQHQADMEVFHYLVDHGKEITRTIKVLPEWRRDGDGIDQPGSGRARSRSTWPR